MLDSPVGLLDVSRDGSFVVAGLKSLISASRADVTLPWRHGDVSSPHRLAGSAHTSNVSISPDGRWIARSQHQVEIWDAGNLEMMWLPESDRGYLQVAIARDGSRLAFGGADKLIHIFDPDPARFADASTGATPGSLRGPWRGHAGRIMALAFDPSGEILASAGREETINLWSVATGEVHAVFCGHTAPATFLQFGPDGKFILSTSADQTIRLWTQDPHHGITVLTDHTNYVYAAEFTPDGQRIVSGGWDGTLRIWDAAGGELLDTLRNEEPPKPGRPDYDFITAVSISRDGKLIASAQKLHEWRPPMVRLRSAQTGELLRDITSIRGRGEVASMTFTPDGQSLFIACHHGGISRMSLDDEEELFILARSARAMALSPCGGKVAIGLHCGTIGLHDAATGNLLREIDAHGQPVRALAFSPDGMLLASGSEDSAVKLWDAEQGEPLAAMQRHWGPVYALAFSPDGQHLASGSEDTTIQIWSIPSGDDLTQLAGHSEYVYSLNFSPDGSRLISASGDTTVRIWDTRPVHERWRARYGASPADPALAAHAR